MNPIKLTKQLYSKAIHLQIKIIKRHFGPDIKANKNDSPGREFDESDGDP